MNDLASLSIAVAARWYCEAASPGGPFDNIDQLQQPFPGKPAGHFVKKCRVCCVAEVASTLSELVCSFTARLQHCA